MGAQTHNCALWVPKPTTRIGGPRIPYGHVVVLAKQIFDAILSPFCVPSIDRTVPLKCMLMLSSYIFPLFCALQLKKEVNILYQCWLPPPTYTPSPSCPPLYEQQLTYSSHTDPVTVCCYLLTVLLQNVSFSNTHNLSSIPIMNFATYKFADCLWSFVCF
jgi:hypothetical protein